MKKNSRIAKECRSRRDQSRKGLSAQYASFRRCDAAYVADVLDYSDKIQFETPDGKKKRATVRINRIKPYVNAVKGWFAENRGSPNYTAMLPDNPGAPYFSKYMNTVSDTLRDKMNANQVETQQDGDMLRIGLGVVDTALTFGEGRASRDANGAPEMGCLDPFNFWWDPTARETGLLDSRWEGYDRVYDLEDALDLFAASTQEDFESSNSEKVGKDYEYDPTLGSYDRIKYEWADRREKTVTVSFYQWYDVETYFRADNPLLKLQNPESQQRGLMEMERIASETKDEDFDPRAESICFSEAVKTELEEVFGEFIEPLEFRRKVFYTAVVSGEKVFKAFKSEHQGGFTYKVKTGDYDPKNKIWTGLVNSMIEPWEYYNKLLTELMFIIAANSKGGLIIEEGAVEDIEELEDKYAKTDAICVVRDGAISLNKIMPKRTPFQPTGYEQLITLMDKSISDVNAIDPTFLGNSENKLETAMLQRQRIRQIASVLACYVDAADLYQIEHGRLMEDLIRTYVRNNRGALIPMLGEQGNNEFITLSEQFLVKEYAINVTNAPATPEERQEKAEMFTSMGDKYLAASQFQKADACYAMAAKYSDLDPEDLQELTAAISGGQQIDPEYVKGLEQKVQELSSQQVQAEVGNVNADTGKKVAETAKLKTDALKNMAQIPDIRAGVHQKAATTAKALEEAMQTNVETHVLKKTPIPKDVHVNA
jgi:hypothetical protein